MRGLKTCTIVVVGVGLLSAVVIAFLFPVLRAGHPQSGPQPTLERSDALTRAADETARAKTGEILFRDILGVASLWLADAVASDIQKHVPHGWTCVLLSEKGKMGHPHGLGEPLFRLDCINTNLTFQARIKEGQYKPVHPNLRLHFHGIAEREHVLQTIEREKFHSWAIPVLFAETREYVVVTSPLWYNNFAEQIGGSTWGVGVYTEEANKAIAPLIKALKTYFDGQRW